MVRPEGHRPDWLQCPVGIYVKHGSQFCMVIQSEKLYQTIVGELQVAPPYVCNGHEVRAFCRSSYWRPEFPCVYNKSCQENDTEVDVLMRVTRFEGGIARIFPSECDDPSRKKTRWCFSTP